MLPVQASSLSRSEIIIELARLDREERSLSMRRNMLHKRIDSLYLSAPLDDEQASILNDLEALEQDVSRERRELHSHIDSVRAAVGLPAWRDERRFSRRNTA